MATIEQVTRVKKLIEIVKVDDETVAKWFTKADVDTWEEMNSDTIQKCIDFLEKKVASLVEQHEEAMQTELKETVAKNKGAKK